LRGKIRRHHGHESVSRAAHLHPGRSLATGGAAGGRGQEHSGLLCCAGWEDADSGGEESRLDRRSDGVASAAGDAFAKARAGGERARHGSGCTEGAVCQDLRPCTGGRALFWDGDFGAESGDQVAAQAGEFVAAAGISGGDFAGGDEAGFARRTDRVFHVFAGAGGERGGRGEGAGGR